jgi:putative PEP-CTERM system TPR-repeat lipoprotein
MLQFLRKAPVVCLIGALAACSANSDRKKQAYVDSGDRYFAAGQYNEAVVEYRSAIQLNPRFAAAHSKLAAAYARRGNTDDALAEYVRASDSQPEDASLQLVAGNALLVAHQYDEARQRASAVLGKDPRNVEGLILLGNSLARLNDPAQAIEKIEEAIALDPTKSSGYTSLAVIQAAEGHGAEAEGAFRKAVDLEPLSSRAHLTLGNYLWASGRVADAETSFRRALQLAPLDPLVNRALSALCLTTNRREEAERYLKTIANNDRSSRFVLADYLLSANRSREAVTELEPLRNDRTYGREATRRLARAYADLAEYPKADALADELLKIEPSNAETLLIKGQLLFVAGGKEEALVRVKAAAQSDPNSARIQFTLGKLLTSLGEVEAAQRAFNRVLALNPRATRAQLELAQLQLMTSSPKASVKLAEDVIKATPENIEARVALVRGLLASGDLARAEAELFDLARSNPTSAAVATLQGTLAISKKDPAAGRKAFERAVELDSMSIDPLAGLVELDLSEKKLADAKGLVDRRLAAGPPRADLYVLASTVASANGDPAAAERFLRRAIDIDPATLQAYVMLAQIYIGQHRLDEAKTEFATLARHQSRPVAALTMAGMLELVQGKVPAAQERFEQVLAIEPMAVIASNNLAWIYAEAGNNLDTALQLAQTSAAALPRSAEAQDTLGWVLYKKNQGAPAVEALAKSVQTDPQNPIYRYHLGLAYVLAGDSARGRESLERALAINSRFTGSDNARRALAQLQRDQRGSVSQ